MERSRNARSMAVLAAAAAQSAAAAKLATVVVTAAVAVHVVVVHPLCHHHSCNTRCWESLRSIGIAHSGTLYRLVTPRRTCNSPQTQPN